MIEIYVRLVWFTKNFGLAASKLFNPPSKITSCLKCAKSNYKMIKKKNLRALKVTRYVQDMQSGRCIDFNTLIFLLELGAIRKNITIQDWFSPDPLYRMFMLRSIFRGRRVNCKCQGHLSLGLEPRRSYKYWLILMFDKRTCDNNKP